MTGRCTHRDTITMTSVFRVRSVCRAGALPAASPSVCTVTLSGGGFHFTQEETRLLRWGSLLKLMGSKR